MMLRGILGMLLCVLTLSQGCAAANGNASSQVKSEVESTKSEYLGLWRVKKYSFLGVSGLNEDEAKTYIGRLVFLGEQSAEIIDDNCEAPKYSITTHEAKPYIYEMYRGNADNLGFKSETLNVLSVTCLKASYDILFDNQGNLLVNIDGVFFSLEKVQLNNEFSYNGSGDFERKVDVSKSKESKLEIKYHFYSEPDQLIVLDEKGNSIVDTKLKSTKNEQSIEVDLTKLKEIEQLTLKIKSEKGKSSWRISLDYKD